MLIQLINLVTDLLQIVKALANTWEYEIVSKMYKVTVASHIYLMSM